MVDTPTSEVPVKKTCLTYLGVLVLLSCAMTAVLFFNFPAPPPGRLEETPFVVRLQASVAGGAASGLFLTMAIGALSGIVLKARERRLVAASVAGAPLTDGTKVAACGVLVADGPLLVAPFSGTRCVTYHYRITHNTGGKSSTTVTSCWGYALTPCHIETVGGSVRILGYTDFAFAPTRLSGPEMIARARAYFSATTFVTIGLGAIQSSYRALKEVLADDDGTIKTDFGPPPTDLEDPAYSFEEQLALDHEKVCAFGKYAAARGGLVPEPGSVEVFPVALRRGGADEVRRALLIGAFGHLAGALLLAAIAAAAVFGFFKLAADL